MCRANPLSPYDIPPRIDNNTVASCHDNPTRQYERTVNIEIPACRDAIPVVELNVAEHSASRNNVGTRSAVDINLPRSSVESGVHNLPIDCKHEYAVRKYAGV